MLLHLVLTRQASTFQYIVMSAVQFLDVVVAIDGFQHGEEEFNLKTIAAVGCLQQLGWERSYNTNYLLKRPRANLVKYHHQTAQHGHPLLEPGAAQFLAPNHLRAALCDVQLEWLFKNMLPAPPVRLWTKGSNNCCFLATLLPKDGPRIYDLDDKKCPPTKTLNIASSVATSKTLATAIALASWLNTVR